MTRRLLSLPFFLLGLGLALPVLSQETEPSVRDEIEVLKKGQQKIQNELKEIKDLLEARPAAAPAPARPAGPDVAGKVFNLNDNPVKGADTAKLTLVEFTDYQ